VIAAVARDRLQVQGLWEVLARQNRTKPLTIFTSVPFHYRETESVGHALQRQLVDTNLDY